MGHKETISSGGTKSAFLRLRTRRLIIALSSLWAETWRLFLKNIQDGEEARPPAAASDTSSNMAGGKINWQLNDTPCEDDKRHLVAAQEEVW